MKIFLDSADIDEITEAFATGVVDGITTNPSLIKKAQEKHRSGDMRRYIKEVLKLAGTRPVSLEVTEITYESMKSEALKLKKLFGGFKNLVIKIPVNPSNDHGAMENFAGIKLIKELSSQGLKVNATLIMNPEQAVLAAKAGATYVSPFAGRIDDYLREQKLGMRKGVDFQKTDYFQDDGVFDDEGNQVHDNGIVSGADLVLNIAQIFKNYGLKCEILAASARNTRQVREFMLAGAHVATLPWSVIKKMTAHYMSVEGVVGFMNDTVPDYAELLKDKRRFAINMKKE